ncbi:phosphatidate cytidylyltransferase [Serpentinicella alkaliphila]|uniref:Phosphatidate cytidylyltransferase n=1 Tax=Serpentinicella alkaliphila TaxID=1734049 RepID=A0A4R2TQ37_9FIRM|nr:phosphatidate cytidylyltransferase [Serpentinicella alkaliphila]QUH26318.1 phosphatidate cytidylyltransferase [Serpentinicella alkaliphila]TCQ05898.1 phosphatidate cytidylyltransferase [Serpentinicella alkaliphila]
MLKRVLSSLVGAPLLIYILYRGGTLLFLAVNIVSLIALNEFYNAFKIKEYNPLTIIGYIFSIVILTDFFYVNLYFLPILILLFFVCSVIMLANEKYNMIDIMITITGIIYTSLFLGHILLTSRLEMNVAIWLIFLIAWATDTFAYFTGYFFGKHKLCPTISPKKTVEGSIGGIVGSVLSCLLFGHYFLGTNFIYLAILGIVGSIIAQIGDLVASKIKRYIGIKDFGKIMPGHGGILDRFDSIIFVAPVVYYFLIFVI